MLTRLLKFHLKMAGLRDERGATAVEYGLMVALIAIVIIVAVALLGTNLNELFQSVADQRLTRQVVTGQRGRRPTRNCRIVRSADRRPPNGSESRRIGRCEAGSA